jgi:hypothetical protein
MTEALSHSLEVYGRKKALCDICVEIMESLRNLEDKLPYELFYFVAYDLQQDVVNMEKSFAPGEPVNVPYMGVVIYSIIQSGIQHAVSIARMNKITCAAEFTTWSRMTAEDYVGLMYDRETGRLLWNGS